MDLRAALVDQLDPTRKAPFAGRAGSEIPESPIGNTGIAGGGIGGGPSPMPAGVQIPNGGMSWGETQAAQKRWDEGTGAQMWDENMKKFNRPDLMSNTWQKSPTGNQSLGIAAGSNLGMGPAPGSPPVGQQPGQPASDAPDYRKLGKYAGNMSGYDMNKFNRPYDQLSEKYKVGLVNSWFDPNKGITPEYLDALKSLDIGDFSGSGDKLSVANGRNGGRYGAGGTADTIVGLKSGGNAKWGYWTDPALEQGGGGGQAMAGHGGDGAGNGMLGGDAMGNIQQALGKLQQPDLLRQLLAQLQGGG